MNAPIRQGMTLFEILIAVALMGTAMAAVVGFLGSNRDLGSFQAAEDEINRDMSRVMRTISSDLAQSGWHSPGSVTLPVTWATDRTARYWPYVLWQNSTGGNPTGYGFAMRSDFVAMNLKDRLLGFTYADSNSSHVGAQFGIAARQAYLTSYHAPSQELMFLMQITDNRWEDKTGVRFSRPQLSFPDGDWTDTSDANRAALGILYPSVWREGATPDTWVARSFDANGDRVVAANEGLDPGDLTKPGTSYGVPMMAAELNAADTSSFRFQTAWETIAAPDYNAAVIKDVGLREYMYAVLPGRSGLGRLVRAYKVALGGPYAMGTDPGQIISADATNTYGMRVEEILSENVVRAVFDTARTDRNLSLNQVRARIYFLRKSEHDADLYARQILDVVFAMRARNTAIDRASDRKIFVDAGRFDPVL